MSKQYPINCPCGSQMAILVDDDCKILKVYCYRCQRMLLDTELSSSPALPSAKKDAPSSDQYAQADTILNAAPKRIKLSSTGRHEKIGKYRLIKKLGKGATSVVHLAVDETTQEKVAIKVLKTSTDNTKIDYFLREVQILLEIQHPNIVYLKDQGNHNGYPFLVMEFVDGKTVEDLLKEGLSTGDTLKIILYVLEALEYAHEKKFVHRDIKPENVLVSQNYEVKLTDLGLGKILDDSYQLTKTGNIMGTAFYMAPEQITDAKNVDHRSDIYAVGATLYHMLSGTPPYQEFQHSHLALFKAKIENRLASLAEKCPKLPNKLIKTVERAMAHKREKRYDSAGRMKKRILEILEAHQL